jgi:aromatic-amino-acid transaminase
MPDYLVKGDRPGDDPIFALNAEASARKARGEPVVNATIGALLDDEGKLAILPTASRAIREVAAEEWAPYAPISGSPAFLDAVVADLFADRPAMRERACAVATPGGTGALRHAISTFLERGQAVATSSFYWGPYATIADEHERKVATFSMFGEKASALDSGALDRALGDLVAKQGRALLFLNDPCHNPTGYSMSDADWDAAAEVIGRHADRAPVAVLLDAAYSAYGPHGLSVPLALLEKLVGRALVLVAWSASKSFTHYGLRVGSLVAVAADAKERARMAAALGYACRGTWSNCNRGGMAAITRCLVDPALRASVADERAGLVRLLADRVRAFNEAARPKGLRYPRYDGGFFVTVFANDAKAAAERMKADGVFVVPQPGALRVALCSVAAADVPRLVDSLARAVA